jgi:hypothetical protein
MGVQERRLLADDGKDVTVEGGVKNPETTFKAAELAARVSGRQIAVYDFEKVDDNRRRIRAEGPAGVNVYRTVLDDPAGQRGDYAQRRTLIHESMHFVPRLNGWGRSSSDGHTPVFNRAAEQILGPMP